MNWLSLTWSIMLVTSGFITSAQSLQQPLEAVPMSNEGAVLLKSGELITGKILNTTSVRGITQVTLMTVDEEKRKFRTEEMEEFMISMNKAVKLQFFNERGSSIVKILSKNQPKGVPQDYIIYRNTVLKSGKEALLQLLNPGFDDTFQVFYDPYAAKSATMEGEYLTITGDKHKAFYVSKNDQALLKVKKGGYHKSYKKLFGECAVMQQEEKPKWNDLGQHIWMYDQVCGPGLAQN
ncbi:MAG: hypothetical protein RLO17_15375 [Cyclobacteriaceae bacterium]